MYSMYFYRGRFTPYSESINRFIIILTPSKNNNIINYCLITINCDIDCDGIENKFVFSVAAQGGFINHCDQNHCNHIDINIEIIQQENNSNFAKFCIDLIVTIMNYTVIWYPKLQSRITCTILSVTKFEYTAHLVSLQETTLSATVNGKIKNGFNLLHHQLLTFKATVHENITSALQLAQPGSGCNTYHSRLNTLKLRLKLKHTEIIQYLIIIPLELTKFITSYISRGSSTVLLLVTLHQLRELQRSNEHKGVSDKFMSG